MGGAVFVGIKKNNIEHLMIRNTNALSYWFHKSDFQNGKECVEEYINMVKKNLEEDPDSWICFVDKIQPAEYGVVLIDFDSKQVTSKQGYCSLGQYTFSRLADENQIELVEELMEKDLISKITVLNRSDEKSRFSIIPMNEFQKWFDDIKSDKENIHKIQDKFDMVFIDIKTDLQIDHSSKHAAYDWKNVEQFIKTNNWKSSIWSFEDVKTEFDYLFEE